jgi:outer membrane protein
MRHIAAILSAITFMSLASGSGSGQAANGPQAASGPDIPRLTLQDAVRTALEKHPTLQSAGFAVQSAEARVKQAQSYYYPQVGASAVQTNGSIRSNALFRPSGSLIESNRSDFSVGVAANQLVYDFGQTKYRVESQRADRSRFEKEALARRADIVLGVERSYLSVLKRKRLVQIAEQTVRERETIKQQVDTLYRNQIKSKLDLGLVQVQLADAEFSVIQARNDLSSAFAELNNAMGIEGPSVYELEDVPVTVGEPDRLDSLLAEAQGRRPELVALKERVRTAENRIKTATSSNLPTVQAFGSAGDTEHISNRPNLQEGGWWAAGAVVSVPLFTGFLIQNQVTEAISQKREAESIYLALLQDIQLQVKENFLAVGTLIRQVKVAQEQVAIARESLGLARQRYKLGLSSIVEVTQSEVAVTGAETRLAEVEYNARIAEAQLRYAVGGI